MQINSIKNQPVITAKTELKTDKKQLNNDTVSMGDSGTKIDYILNYKNLAAQNACNCKKGVFEKHKTPIETGAGALAGAGIALLAGSDPKIAAAAAVLGAGTGFIGSKLEITSGFTIGTAAGIAFGTALAILENAPLGGSGLFATAVIGGAAGGAIHFVALYG
jgi:hypothetical protein